ncbi:MAG TPA: YcxB family protein [Micromonosporaceae bacterium]|nr:YcxB family protein [Micromonosporaceae bacterium]
MFTVAYEATEAEVRANFEINNSSPRARRTRLVEWGCAAVVIIVGVVLLAAGSDAIGIGIVILGALFAVMLAGLRAAAKAGTKLQCTPTTVTVADDGITIATQRGQRVTAWHAVRTGTENYLGWSLLATPPIGFLPRRAFTPDQQAELAALIARHVGANLRWAGPASGTDAGTPTNEPDPVP